LEQYHRHAALIFLWVRQRPVIPPPHHGPPWWELRQPAPLEPADACSTPEQKRSHGKSGCQASRYTSDARTVSIAPYSRKHISMNDMV